MFELRFYLKNNQSYDYQSVERFLLNINHVTKSEEVEKTADYTIHRFNYFNERTGVQATFSNWELESDRKMHIKTDNLLIFPGFTETPMRFMLEFNKPSFFAREIMPIISKLNLEFEFYIFDVQNKDSKEPMIQHSGQLIESWVKSNQKYTTTNIQGHSQNISLRGDLADNWWEYMVKLDEFRNISPESVFIPEMIILQHKKTGELYRAVTWADFMPIALPTCEKVAIIQTQGLYKIKLKDLGIYDCSELLNAFAPYFSDYELYNRKFNVLSIENSENHNEDFAELLKNLKLHKSRKFKVLNSDDLQNIKIIC